LTIIARSLLVAPFDRNRWHSHSEIAIIHKNKTISYEVSLSNVTRRIEFGLFNFLKSKSMNKIKEYKGIVFTL
uniref:hypothetical protein n=1 Tax=Aquimarina algiphila TaxID=2047982 RepID=UPI00232C41C7